MKRKKTADKRRQEIITEKRKAARIQIRPEIEMLAVDRLVPYAKNAKKHDDRQVAAQNLGRKCYGLEISPAYCAVILQRMADAFPGIDIRKADA